VSQLLVLVGAQHKRDLTDAHLRNAAGALDQGATAGWLAEGVAAEIALPAAISKDDASLIARVRRALGDAAIDLAVVDAKERHKRLFLADMDSTVIEQECIDELAAHVGLRAEVSAITERAMRGEIAFEPALRERVAMLKGLPVGLADDLIERRITISPGARALVATMRAHGTYCCLVSGGFTLFTTVIARKLGFDEHRANRLAVRDGRLTGEVEEPILGRDAKFAALVELRERLSLPRAAVLAVGDGANDLAMLREAGLGVAYRAKPAVAAAAHVRIDHADLSALLYLQGYRRAEFTK
jgi:phosphoserine phosphatase